MGSKNLKAIVARGHGSVKVADPARFMDRGMRFGRWWEAPESGECSKYGTLFVLPGKRMCGISYKNFQECVVARGNAGRDRSLADAG